MTRGASEASFGGKVYKHDSRRHCLEGLEVPGSFGFVADVRVLAQDTCREVSETTMGPVFKNHRTTFSGWNS